MNHPELLAVPVLMLADYLLTILGAKSAAVVYRRHYLLPSYELNPLFRNTVDRQRWFNPIHLALVVFVTGALLLLDQMEPVSVRLTASVRLDVVDFAFGMFLGSLGTVIGRHLSNLLMFGYVNRHPTEISGEIRQSMPFMLKVSQLNYGGTLPLLLALAVLAPTSHTIGAVLGLCALIAVHHVWLEKAKSAAAGPDRG